MTIAYLNGDYLPVTEARISPLDRGFLFGDGIYEVIPCHQGKTIGFSAHMDRMGEGLEALEIASGMSAEDWLEVVNQLLQQNATFIPSGYIGIYLHVSRGTDTRRFHAYPKDLSPTLFAFAFELANPPKCDRDEVKGLRVALAQDRRWQRCNIKSTSLLGNVMHYQHSYQSGLDETILFNAGEEVTEASSCNVFAVINGEVVTPSLDHQLLPGITRKITLQALQTANIPHRERPLTVTELKQADEVWLTSASKEISPVTEIQGQPVGNGKAGPVWYEALTAFNTIKFSA
ncbi:aminotransferase class IV [Alteromonas sp. ASW11-19]|uniref:Aminotransferase class IV n=1 Tax=Alteromonas salexigens TaxID=2982530 RepID=A0ABT2VL14_9ALTE|nr:aminotransferase class IV [Alteromonas salexigens]MCU7553996.1 aminotransferase class IV [Alteromonas salexigens]